MAIPRFKKPKYRSGLEHVVAVYLERASITAGHEKETLKYLQPAVTRRYLVDFILEEHPHLILEVKGRFTGADRKKMLLIKEQYPDRQIVMLFGKANNKLNKNSPTTYSDWCDKNDIHWIDIEQFKENPKCLLSLTKRVDGKSSNPPKKSKKQSRKLVKE